MYNMCSDKEKENFTTMSLNKERNNKIEIKSIPEIVTFKEKATNFGGDSYPPKNENKRENQKTSVLQKLKEWSFSKRVTVSNVI